MNKKSIIIIFLVFLCFKIVTCQSINKYNKVQYLNYMIACDNFVKNYKPTYIIENDTLVVSQITAPSDSINEFLLYCSSKCDYRPLKYALVIIIKQYRIYLSENNSDYIIQSFNYNNNGFVELVKRKLKMKSDSNSSNFFPYYHATIFNWAIKNKNKIPNYEYIDEFLKEPFQE